MAIAIAIFLVGRFFANQENGQGSNRAYPYMTYDTDIDRVKAILMEVITSAPRVLTEPTPVVGLLTMADSSFNFAVRPWCETQHYLRLQMTLQENIKKRLGQEGISIPFPQRDVHLFTAAKGASIGEILPMDISS